MKDNIIFIGLFLLLSLSISSAVVITTARWDINNQAGNTALSSYPVLLNISDLGAAGLSSCYNNSFYYIDAPEFTLIPHYVESAVSGCLIWLKVPTIAAPGQIQKEIGVVPNTGQIENGSAVFTWFADFTDGSLPSGCSLISSYASITNSSGILTMKGTGTTTNGQAHIVCNGAFPARNTAFETMVSLTKASYISLIPVGTASVLYSGTATFYPEYGNFISLNPANYTSWNITNYVNYIYNGSSNFAYDDGGYYNVYSLFDYADNTSVMINYVYQDSLELNLYAYSKKIYSGIRTSNYDSTAAINLKWMRERPLQENGEPFFSNALTAAEYGNVSIISPANNSNIYPTQVIYFNYTSDDVEWAWCTYKADAENDTHAFNYNPVWFALANTTSTIQLSNDYGQFTNGEHTIEMACMTPSFDMMNSSDVFHYNVVNGSNYTSVIAINSPANMTDIATNQTITYTYTSANPSAVWCTYNWCDDILLSCETYSHSFNYNPIVLTPNIEETSINLFDDTGLIHNGTHWVSIICENSLGSIVAASPYNLYDVVNESGASLYDVTVFSPANGSNILTNQQFDFRLISYMDAGLFCTYELDNQTDDYSFNYNPITFAYVYDIETFTDTNKINMNYLTEGWHNISIICTGDPINHTLTANSTIGNYNVVIGTAPPEILPHYISYDLLTFALALICLVICAYIGFTIAGASGAAMLSATALILFSTIPDPPFIPLWITVIAIVGGLMVVVYNKRE